MKMKKTKRTKIPRAVEKARRFDDAIRHLRHLSREAIRASTNVPGQFVGMAMLDSAAFNRAADALAGASD